MLIIYRTFSINETFQHFRLTSTYCPRELTVISVLAALSEFEHQMDEV